MNDDIGFSEIFTLGIPLVVSGTYSPGAPDRTFEPGYAPEITYASIYAVDPSKEQQVDLLPMFEELDTLDRLDDLITLRFGYFGDKA